MSIQGIIDPDTSHMRSERFTSRVKFLRVLYETVAHNIRHIIIQITTNLRSGKKARWR